jgi:plastocyanin
LEGAFFFTFVEGIDANGMPGNKPGLFLTHPKTGINKFSMKKTVLLLIGMTALCLHGHSTIFTIHNNGNAFTPTLITINDGDTVSFVLASNHDAREVSQASWTANSNTALAGGFQTALGGGVVTNLTVGTHYYVCTPHVVQFGMKGRIVVQSLPSGIAEKDLRPSFSVYPNPSAGKFRIVTSDLQQFRNVNIEIINVLGKLVYSEQAENPVMDIDLQVPSGIYIVKITDQKATLIKRIQVG